MEPKLRIAAITDEFSADLETALEAMSAIGMTGAELRVLWDKNILDLSDAELERATAMLLDKGMQVMSIASPILKCVLPDGPAVDSRLQHDAFASKHSHEDQPRLLVRAFEIAHKTGAKIIRVFSYWKTVEPGKCFGRIVETLLDLAERAAREDLIIGLENEWACNVSTAADTAPVLRAADHPNLKLVWDPANAFVSGEVPFPGGYGLLPASRIVHVHAKDCFMNRTTPDWGPLGACGIDWKGQMAALWADGYRGWVSLETHWPGPAGDKLQASTICGWNLKALAAG